MHVQKGRTERQAGYFREFRLGWRPLAAASIGMASGYTINNYLNNIFIPPLMQEFGWQSSDVALIGAAITLSVIFQPLAGRLADQFGVKLVALFGVVMSAVVYVLMSLMTGNFWIFLLLVVLQIATVTSTTGAVVYSRLIAHSFGRARGMALATAVCAPSVVGVLAVPLLTVFIDDHGWRAGYLLAAACVLVAGLVAVLMAPPDRPRRADAPQSPRSKGDLKAIASSRAFRLILVGVMLCSLSISLQTTQLKVVLIDAGLDSARASEFIAIYALGVIAGRFLSGAALDTLPTYAVAAVAMSLPAVGLLILSTGTSNLSLLIVAMAVLGVSLGAEGDVAAYLVMRYFPLHIYSTVLGVVIGAIAFAAGIGGLLLSAMLRIGGPDFTPFLALSGVLALIGGFLFWQLRRAEPEIEFAESNAQPH